MELVHPISRHTAGVWGNLLGQRARGGGEETLGTSLGHVQQTAGLGLRIHTFQCRRAKIVWFFFLKKLSILK